MQKDILPITNQIIFMAVTR